MMDPVHILTAFAICSIIGIPSYKMNVVDFSGLLSGYVVGMGVILFTDLKWFILIFMFFFLSGAATKYKYDKKKKKGVAQEKKGARGYLNVFGNGLVALSLAVLEGIVGGKVFFIGYVASVATATADTAGGEIGRLSKKNPRLITNLKEVPTGTEGAVSLLGEAAEFLMALFIGIVAFIMGYGYDIIIIAASAGFIGANIDSIIGATLETKMEWWGNNWTNFTSTLIGAFAGIVIYSL